ncbi:EVE domain-containing protein [Gilvimarinus sp. SDUM040013]|uniref:EVE domain-containing protein n=1 Tax=Gilvimarinus gilvus TaxID=3058038 RepID=A0ABU4S3N4_9GAMM|nr:EVE domain-containing protein [Gilvimarinus sp. SDUM040013]MDO3387779.1 EVE domain-containing protein [Gilvimarinus sp. SDUM040013]MDX6851554.1 EVE domain-containing protein [Gilvimarinus sp. SDUM040013]
MNVYIFQSVPDRFDLETELVKNKKDTWYATRYRKKMKVGDYVFFWMAGPDERKGVYGWGVIDSDPYIKDDWNSYGVDVTYKEKFGERLSKSMLQGDAILKNILLFRAPQATNFLLSEEEAKALINLTKSRGENPPVIGA